MTLTAIYASLLGLLLIWLSARVIGWRRRQRVSIGDDGERGFQHAIRAHANFAEYAPIGLILIGLAESQGAPGMFIHGLGLSLLLGRLAHAIAFSAPRMNFSLRTAGMILTFAAIAFAAVLNLTLAVLLFRSGL